MDSETIKGHRRASVGRIPIPAALAQLVEQLTCNEQVIGSSPIRGFENLSRPAGAHQERLLGISHGLGVTGSSNFSYVANVAECPASRPADPPVSV